VCVVRTSCHLIEWLVRQLDSANVQGGLDKKRPNPVVSRMSKTHSTVKYMALGHSEEISRLGEPRRPGS
jgi:predicted RNA-binding protein with EMAP domain